MTSTFWLRLLTLSLVSTLLWSTKTAAQSPLQHVLPPSAEGLVRAALIPPAAQGLTGLGVEQVSLNKDHVVLTLRPKAKGARVEVILRHPSVVDGARAVVPAFSLHGQESTQGILDALKRPLSTLSVDALWRAVEPAPEPAVERPSPRNIRPDPPGLVSALHQAREALRVGAPERVAKLLAPFIAQSSRLSAPARIDLASLIWRSGDPQGAGRLVEGISADAQGTVLAWQADTLRGQSPGLETMVAALDAMDRPCEALALSRLLKQLDKREAAAGLRQALATREPPCPQAQVAEIRHLLNSDQVSKAEALSARAIARFSEVKELVSVRARVLIAAGRPAEAAALLEARAFQDPKSVSLSSLLGAYNRVESIEWKREKMDEMARLAKREPTNHVAAFIAGVLFHYDGRLAESDVLLEPLLDTPLSDQARLHIYLGMNAFDLGDPVKGMAYVDKVADDPHPDPDVHYCRAEILRMTDPVAAREALKRYLSYTDQSATKNSAKQQRVATLLANLDTCVAEGTRTPCPGPWEHPRGEGVSLFDYRTSHQTPITVYLALALAALLPLLAIWFRRRSSS